MILDEPTSGLDAFTAYNVLKLVKDMCLKRNIAVLMTLHQPRTDILDLIDNFLLLSAGRTVFYGALGSALDHFKGLGFIIPTSTNPSDFFLDVISLDQRSAESLESSKKRIEKFGQSWAVITKEIFLPLKIQNYPAETSVIEKFNPYHELVILLQRNGKIMIRDKISFFASVISSFVISIIMGALFWQSPLDSKGVQNRTGALFFTAINATFSNVIPMLSKFEFEKQIAKRERASNSYRSYNSFISKWLVNIPTVLFSSLIFTLPLYWMVGLRNDAQRFIYYVLVLNFHSIVSSAFGAFIAAAVPSTDIGVIIAPTIVTIFLLYGGPLVSLSLLPGWLRWFRYISIICNTTAALITNEFSGVKLSCANDTIICVKDGDAVIEQFDFTQPSGEILLIINLALLAGFLILGIYSFHVRSSPQMRLN